MNFSRDEIDPDGVSINNRSPPSIVSSSTKRGFPKGINL